MSIVTAITETEVRRRLKKSGKSSEEIESLIDQYASVSSGYQLNTDSISEILRKTQEESIFRVKGFKLSRDQFDALFTYYEEAGRLTSEQSVDGSILVRLALSEFIELIS